MGLNFLKKLNPKHQKVAELPSADAAVSGDISKRDLFRCRANFGVNLGSCFIREKWMFEEMMNGKETELEAIKEDIKLNGVDGAREKLERFWREFMNDDDWNWLQSHGVNSVRIPIGYWNIDNGSFTRDTPFEEVTPVYNNSWNILKTNFIEAAARFDITVLVDLHALPGGANNDAHSGESSGNSNSALFWKDHKYQDKMIDAVRFMARDLKGYENIAGIQVVNEAMSSDSSNGQPRYYEKGLKAVREEDASLPFVISDAWNPGKFAEWVQDIQGSDKNLGVVIDTHCYRMFTSDDQNKSGQQIIDDLQNDFVTNIRDNAKGVDFMMGEFSCVLSGNSWKLSNVNPDDPNDPGRKELASQFGKRQIYYALQRAMAGVYFWSYKFPYSWGEWDARVVLGDYINAPKVKQVPEGAFEQLRDRELDAHKNYWNNVGGNYEFDRYEDGFTDGWNDCDAFASSGSMIGRKEAIKFARLQEHIESKGRLDHLWEYEQGYDKAVEQYVNNFYEL